MQDDVIKPVDIKSRVCAIANRAIPPEYIARTRFDFAVLLVFALVICAFAFVLGNRESVFLPVGLGFIVGCISYGVSRLAYGRRLFFTRKRFPPAGLVTIAFALAIPVTAIFFPEFLSKLYDAIWFLIAIGTFVAIQAVEGFIRKEWES